MGGIEYDLPRQGLRLKIEYDTSNPDSDFRKKIPKVDSRINLGFNYSWSENLSFSSSFERGSQFRFAFKLIGNFLEDTIPKPKPKRVQKLNPRQQENIRKNNDIFYRSLNLSLQEESIYIQGANLSEDQVDVAVASSKYYSFVRPIGRTARIVSALSPDEVKNKYSLYEWRF